MAKSNSLNVLESCEICPPPGTIANHSLPLTFFDIMWIYLQPMQHLLFYEFPHSSSYFMQTTVPNLKHSLSLALKNYFPLSGNLVIFPNLSVPEIRYSQGDSIPLTFAECSNDFDHLTGFHPRNADEFHVLVPKLTSASMMSDLVLLPLVAIQVTLFPNSGLCIGFSMRHAAVDGGSFHNFIKTWASITKLGEEDTFLVSGELPILDRTLFKDPNGLATAYWKNVREEKFYISEPQMLPTNKMRASFVMGQADVQKLKESVLAECPTLSHVSTFTIASAYTWACLVKAEARIGEEVSEDKTRHFIFSVDCRVHLDPPLPKTYFGNCLVLCFVSTKSTILVGKDGFVVAVKLIGEAIREKLHNEVGVMKDAETIYSNMSQIMQVEYLGVSASPKFLVYEIDFGWGKPKKNEIISIDGPRCMSLSEGKNGGVEIGLSLPKANIDAFAEVFADGLKVQKG